MKVSAMEKLGTNGIEESLSKLRSQVIDQQTHVMQLYFAPHFIRQIVTIVLIFQNLYAFFGALIVVSNTLTRIFLGRFPIATFKTLLRHLRRRTEQAVMLIKTVEYGPCNVECNLRRQQFRKGDLGHQRQPFQNLSIQTGKCSAR